MMSPVTLWRYQHFTETFLPLVFKAADVSYMFLQNLDTCLTRLHGVTSYLNNHTWFCSFQPVFCNGSVSYKNGAVSFLLCFICLCMLYLTTLSIAQTI